MEIKYILSGLIVGFLTGLTGIGGGSLMTPILILFLGFAPIKAVCTDLLFNAITKMVGVAVLHKRNYVDWKWTGLLLLGSLSAAALSLILLKWLDVHSYDINGILKKAVVSILLFLIMMEGKLIFKRFISTHYLQLRVPERLRMALTISIIKIFNDDIFSFCCHAINYIKFIVMSHHPFLREICY